MNDFLMAYINLNVQHLQRVDNGQTIPEEQNFVLASQIELYISNFTDLIPMLLKSTPSSPVPTFGFTSQDDNILKRAFAKTIRPKYPSSDIFYNPRSTNHKPRGDFVASIHGACVFTSSRDLKHVHLLHEQGCLELKPQNHLLVCGW